MLEKGSKIYGDKAYLDYLQEDLYLELFRPACSLLPRQEFPHKEEGDACSDFAFEKKNM